VADVVSVEEVANAMYKMVEESQGQKKLKPTDLIKAMLEIYEGRTDKKACKAAIKELVNSGKCVYTYFGGSFIEIPHKEGAAND
jgi:hypothetical protein